MIQSAQVLHAAKQSTKKNKSREFTHAGHAAAAAAAAAGQGCSKQPAQRQIFIGEALNDALIKAADDAICRFFSSSYAAVARMLKLKTDSTYLLMNRYKPYPEGYQSGPVAN